MRPDKCVWTVEAARGIDKGSSLTMKLPHLILFILSLAIFGCNSAPPPGPKPFVGILNAKKIGNGPADTSKYEVVVHYENVVPEHYEVKVGFGYYPSDEGVKSLTAAATGVYAPAYSEVLHSTNGDLHLTIEPKIVRDLKGKLDGKIHATLSPYPHGKEWLVAGHDIFPLPPE